MMWGMQAWSWWGWLAMSVGMIAFWGLVIWAIVAIFRGSDWTWRRPDPERILAERFAAGEIDEDEYQRHHHRAPARLLGQARAPLRPADAVLRAEAVRRHPRLDLLASHRRGLG